MKRMVMMVLVWLIGRAAGGTVVSADEAQGRLKEGNARYAAGESAQPRTGPDRRAAIAAAQKPWATILSCSDSRVPPEYIFD